MDDPRRHLGRGFNWLGGATLISKIVDFATILAVLLFLTKHQVGIASLVVSVGMVVEAFNGLGTTEALIQAPTVSRLQLNSVFWYAAAAATLAAGLLLLAAPLIQRLYAIPGLALYFIAIAIKQPLVGAAVVPLALLNRDLQYSRIAIVNVCATLGAALTRLALAASGAGSWALVIGYAASGLFTLLGATLARPFRPSLTVQISSIAPLMRFGLRAAAANMNEQVFKNIDYLLIGWFYGATQLAIYRVAFDIAMEPAMAAGTLVSRTALPVFARVADIPGRMAETLAWSLHRVATLVAPLMTGIILAAPALTALIHDKQGNSYAAAATPLRILAAAALLRVTTQLLSAAMMGAGRPGTAARLSATTLLLLGGGILAIGLTLPARAGIIAASAIWLALYPLVIVWGAAYLARHWRLTAADLAASLAQPLAAAALMAVIVELGQHLFGGTDPKRQLATVLASLALTYAAMLTHQRRHPHRPA